VASPLLLDFLRQFGDMKITYAGKRDPNWLYWWLIDPIKAMKNILPEHLESYTHRWIKRPLCVIGFNEDGSTLATTPEGDTYDFWDKWVVKYGNTPYEALNNILDAHKPISRVLPPVD
jgi:hypothetical protein